MVLFARRATTRRDRDHAEDFRLAGVTLGNVVNRVDTLDGERIANANAPAAKVTFSG